MMNCRARLTRTGNIRWLLRQWHQPMLCGSIVLSLLLPTSPAQSADVDEARLADVLERMFEAGSRKDGLQRAAAFRAQALGLSDNDPRVDYAWGLVLLDRLKRDDALQAFARASESEQVESLPAWRARIWLLINTRKETEAFEVATQLGRSLKEWQDVDDPNDDVTATAEWLGRLLAAVESIARNDIIRGQVTTLYDSVDAAFGDGILGDAFRAGSSSLDASYEEVSRRTDQATRERNNRQQERAAATLKRIEARQQELKTEQEDSELLEQDAKAWLDDMLKKTGRELSGLEKDFQFLLKQSQTVESAMLELRREWQLFELRENSGRLGQQRSAASNVLRRTNLARSSQVFSVRMAELETENSRLAQQANQVVVAAQAVQKRQTAAIRRYEQVTGDLVKRRNDIKKWGGRLDKLKKAATDKKSAAPEKSAAPRKLRFRQLVDFRVDEQQRTLLTSLRGDDDR